MAKVELELTREQKAYATADTYLLNAKATFFMLVGIAVLLVAVKIALA